MVVLVGAPVEPPELRLDVADELDPEDVPPPHGGVLGEQGRVELAVGVVAVVAIWGGEIRF